MGSRNDFACEVITRTRKGHLACQLPAQPEFRVGTFSQQGRQSSAPLMKRVIAKLRAHGDPGGDASIAAQNPSDIAFERIYDEWFEHVSRWVAALGASEADREDLVQDVFIVAHRRLASFDGGNLAGWLYQIARRKVRDYRSLAWVKHFGGASRARAAAPALVEWRHQVRFARGGVVGAMELQDFRLRQPRF
jgi:hypothetical protein